MKQALNVTIPGDGTVTGVAFASIGGAFNGDTFLFDSEDGTVSGWRGALGTNAEVLQTANTSNIYKGITVATISGHGYAYLANFGTGSVDILKGDAGAPDLVSGKFTDPNIPAGYAPFNVQRIGNVIYVTYALQSGTGDDVPGLGHGFLSAFDLQGNLIQQLVSGGVLNSPWGVALAPAGFGDFGGDLLVGNFGGGFIHVFNPTTGAPLGTLNTPQGNPIFIEGLWALQFGNGANAGPASSLFFTAGPNGETDGLFGVLAQAPEPGT